MKSIFMNKFTAFLASSYPAKLMSLMLSGHLITLVLLMIFLVFISPLTALDKTSIIAMLLLATAIGSIATFFMVNRTLGELNLLKETDPLTGLPTRRTAEARLHSDIARVSRDGNTMLVALLDIDNFDKINHEFGHDVGDVCITHISEELERNIRGGDWLARWGDDEFLMVLWNFNHENPSIVLERIQRQVVHTPMGELMEISLSIGACECQGQTETNELLKTLENTINTVKHTGGVITG